MTNTTTVEIIGHTIFDLGPDIIKFKVLINKMPTDCTISKDAIHRLKESRGSSGLFGGYDSEICQLITRIFLNKQFEANGCIAITIHDVNKFIPRC